MLGALMSKQESDDKFNALIADLEAWKLAQPPGTDLTGADAKIELLNEIINLHNPAIFDALKLKVQ